MENLGNFSWRESSSHSSSKRDLEEREEGHERHNNQKREEERRNPNPYNQTQEVRKKRGAPRDKTWEFLLERIFFEREGKKRSEELQTPKPPTLTQEVTQGRGKTAGGRPRARGGASELPLRRGAPRDLVECILERIFSGSRENRSQTSSPGETQSNPRHPEPAGEKGCRNRDREVGEFLLKRVEALNGRNLNP